MKGKIDIRLIFITLLFISQIYLFYQLKTQNQFKKIITNNIEIRDHIDNIRCEITDNGWISLFNINGNRIIQIGQFGYNQGGGVKLFDNNGNLSTFIDNRIINSFINDSTYATSIGRDMKNNGFVALFDSTGKIFYLGKK